MRPNLPAKIAIIDANALSCIGLNDLLEIAMPGTSIHPFMDITDLQKESDLDSFVHFFVSAPIYISNVPFFRQQKHRSIVLVQGDTLPQLTGVATLNVCQPIPILLQNLQNMRRMAHSIHNGPEEKKIQLSARELEVLALIVRGMINKEIAQQLHIELTTVITHRKKIMDKLGIRTVSGLTLYALMNGIIHVGDI